MANDFSERARTQRAAFEAGEKTRLQNERVERQKATEYQNQQRQRYALRPHLVRVMRQNAIEMAKQLPERSADRVVKPVRVVDVPHPAPRWSLRDKIPDKNTYKWVGLNGPIWLVDALLIGSKTWQETSHCGSGSSSTFRGIVISKKGELRTFDSVFEQPTTNPYPYTNVFNQLRSRLRSPYIAKGETFEREATDEDLIPFEHQPPINPLKDLVGDEPAVIKRWQGRLLGLLDPERYVGLPRPEDIGRLEYMSLAERIAVGTAQSNAGK